MLVSVINTARTMLRSVRAHRHAFLYDLPLDGQPPAAGAVCAVMADVARRYAALVPAWRAAGASAASDAFFREQFTSHRAGARNATRLATRRAAAPASRRSRHAHG